MAECSGLMLYKVYDHLKIDCNNTINAISVVPHGIEIKQIEEYCDMAINSISESNEGETAALKQRNIKISLLYLLNQAITHEKSKDQSQKWLFEKLGPLCYNWIVMQYFNIK